VSVHRLERERERERKRKREGARLRIYNKNFLFKRHEKLLRVWVQKHLKRERERRLEEDRGKNNEQRELYRAVKDFRFAGTWRSAESCFDRINSDVSAQKERR